MFTNYTYVFANETFPTKFRAIGVCLSVIIGSITRVLGPFIYTFLSNNNILP